MATIIMRTDLLQSPKVMRLSARCKCSPILIMGGLYWLWATAQSHSRDGLLSALDAESIDHTTGIPSFSESLKSVGWITITPDGVQIEEFERYFGESAKIREQNRLRAARHRQREASGERNAPSVTDNVTRNGKTRDGVSDDLHGTERNGTQRNENGTEPNSISPRASEGHAGDKSGNSQGQNGDNPGTSAGHSRTGPCPRGWNLDTELAKITAAFPASNSAAAPGAAKNAVRRLGSGWGDTPHPNEWTAAEWLYGRVVAWANSPLCISTPQRYRPGMKKWMDEEMYLADPAQWQGTHESDKSKPEDEDMDAKLARIAARVAESRAKEAKWAAEDAAKAEAAKLNGAKK